MRGLAGTAFNAGKEVALDAFIGGRIGFTAMAGVVEDLLTQLSGQGGLQTAADCLDTVLQMDRHARAQAAGIVAARER